MIEMNRGGVAAAPIRSRRSFVGLGPLLRTIPEERVPVLRARLHQPAVERLDEARIVVNRERDVLIAAPLRGLDPGRADFAREAFRDVDDAEVRSLFAFLVGVGLQSQLRPVGERLDAAGVACAVLGEFSDDSHNFLLFVLWRPPYASSLTARTERADKRASHRIFSFARNARTTAQGKIRH